jgi:hypothetical protein
MFLAPISSRPGQLVTARDSRLAKYVQHRVREQTIVGFLIICIGSQDCSGSNGFVLRAACCRCFASFLLLVFATLLFLLEVGCLVQRTFL